MKKGFTLLELMVIVIVIAVVLTIGNTILSTYNGFHPASGSASAFSDIQTSFPANIIIVEKHIVAGTISMGEVNLEGCAKPVFVTYDTNTGRYSIVKTNIDTYMRTTCQKLPAED